jgi:hypothetical protein
LNNTERAPGKLNQFDHLRCKNDAMLVI